MLFDFNIWLFNNQWFGISVLCFLLGVLFFTAGLLWKDVSRMIDIMAKNYFERGSL